MKYVLINFFLILLLLACQSEKIPTKDLINEDHEFEPSKIEKFYGSKSPYPQLCQLDVSSFDSYIALVSYSDSLICDYEVFDLLFKTDSVDYSLNLKGWCRETIDIKIKERNVLIYTNDTLYKQRSGKRYRTHILE